MRTILLPPEHYLCVFFFKQKTAYELRISDWSSDVCSSDLLQGSFGVAAMKLQASQQVLEAGDCRHSRGMEGGRLRGAKPPRQERRQKRSEVHRVRKECVSTCRYRW